MAKTKQVQDASVKEDQNVQGKTATAKQELKKKKAKPSKVSSGSICM